MGATGFASTMNRHPVVSVWFRGGYVTRPRLLLINPTQWIAGRRQRGWTGTRSVPPLHLAYVAALTPDPWEIRIVDENVRQCVVGTGNWRPDLVGITSYTCNAPRAYELAAQFRDRGIPVVLGGSHASAVPEEVLRYADVAFVGQAEGAWRQLLLDFARADLQAIYDGGVHSLAHLPLPRRDLYPHRYLVEAVVTSLGCPYRCEFCSVWKTSRGRYLLRPVAEVLDELEQIGTRTLFFVDDNLTVDPKRTIELCTGMVERGLEKRFAMMASLEAGQDEELLDWLARAGCFLVCIGIESLDETTLQRLRKASNLKVGIQQYREVIARFQAHGIAVTASIIFGHDTDTQSTFREIEAFVRTAGIDSAVYTILTPLPGTDLWTRLEAEGRLLYHGFPGDYAYFDVHHVTFQPAQLAAGELLAAKRGAVRRATSIPALLEGAWRTWRRTDSPLGAVASMQNRIWARFNAYR
jgi:radical SAM superfamily enzyme YgiQ (UPF0313 family)